MPEAAPATGGRDPLCKGERVDSEAAINTAYRDRTPDLAVRLEVGELVGVGDQVDGGDPAAGDG